MLQEKMVEKAVANLQSSQEHMLQMVLGSYCLSQSSDLIESSTARCGQGAWGSWGYF